MKEKQKVNLSLLKALVSELESALDKADALSDAEADQNLYTIEMSKAMGLASGIMGESGLLIGDIQVLSANNQNVKASGVKASHMLEKLMGAVKPKGSN